MAVEIVWKSECTDWILSLKRSHDSLGRLFVIFTEVISELILQPLSAEHDVVNCLPNLVNMVYIDGLALFTYRSFTEDIIVEFCKMVII